MVAVKQSRRKKENQSNSEWRPEIWGILLIALGVFSLLSLSGMNVGVAGEWTRDAILFFFGKGAFFPALVLVILGARYIYTHQKWQWGTREVIWLVYYLLALVAVSWWYMAPGDELQLEYFFLYGGIIGGAGLLCLRTLFGEDGIGLSLAVIFIINTILLTKWTLSDGMHFVKKKTKPHLEKATEKVREHWQDRPVKKQTAKFFDVSTTKHHTEQDTVAAPSVVESKENPLPKEEKLSEQKKEMVTLPPMTPFAEAPPAPPVWKKVAPVEDTDTLHVQPDLATTETKERRDYRLPPLDLLGQSQVTQEDYSQEVAENAQKLEQLLASFGVEARVIHAGKGPAVTRYELEPGIGVKVSKIVNLADDIALQLAATDVRIEAPIPGKAAVGIEVPNQEITPVHLRDVLSDQAFQQSKGGVVVGLGKDIAGQPVITDLAKMPHLLVAGSTGSGKSVCINTLIASILFRSYPDEVKLILIDPKVVEMAQYNHIPHLMTPVVTDAKKAAGVLRWAVREMENRYLAFASDKVKNVAGYNEVHPETPLPLIVIIIDELADLMMVASQDVEEAVCRLAQKARAAGIHLVLATQRPSVDVITGTIKANIPSRISFAVSSQIDSRTILDMSGAEKLMGKGDMLFYPIGAPKPKRVQGAFISDEQVEELVAYIREQASPVYHEVTVATTEQSATETALDEDELLHPAIEMVLETEQASVSMLQRRFRIGYTRAGRLMDTMESMGIVGPNAGSKSREILITAEEWARRQGDET